MIWDDMVLGWLIWYGMRYYGMGWDNIINSYYLVLKHKHIFPSLPLSPSLYFGMGWDGGIIIINY